MSGTLISVIVPVYSADKYVGACIESILASTNENIELLTVIDGSVDLSEKICREYAKNDARVKVIVKENGGVSSARNAGLDIASGEWIGFVDADDVIEADMYEHLYRKATESGATVAQCAIKIVEKDKSHTIYNDKSGIPVSEKELYSFLSGSVCNKLYLRSAIGEIRFDTRYPIGEDMDFNLKLISSPSAIVFSDEAKYTYIQHKTSACNKKPDKRRLLSYREMLHGNLSRQGISVCLKNFLRRELILADLHALSVITREGELYSDELFCTIKDEVGRIYEQIFDSLDKKTRLKAALLVHAPHLYKLAVKAIHKRNE